MLGKDFSITLFYLQDVIQAVNKAEIAKPSPLFLLSQTMFIHLSSSSSVTPLLMLAASLTHLNRDNNLNYHNSI